MSFSKLKLHNILFILLLIIGCSTEKFIKKDANLLQENRLYIDGEENRSSPLNQLILPKPNTYFLGIPLKLQLNQWSSDIPKEDFKKWLDKKPNRKEKLISLLSPKQVYQLEK